MNLYEAISVRKSVRSYLMEPVGKQVLQEIGDFYTAIPKLFPGIETELGITDNTGGKQMPQGLFVVRAPYYLTIYSETKDRFLMNAGYIMEQLSLFLTTKKLGSCFQGGASPRGKAEREGKKFVIMMAFGKPKESLTRRTADFRRLPMKELAVFKEPPRQWMQQVLDAARLAPSALNSQPWRFVVLDRRIHIFSKKRSLDRLGKFDEFDFGVMFAHMMTASDELWLDVDLIRLEGISQKSFPNNRYVLSAIMKDESG